MSTIAKTYIGVDISKKKLDIFFYPSNELIQVLNNKKGIQQLFKKLKSYNSKEIICEASGGYENLLVKTCLENNEQIRIENPKRIRDFARAKGKKAKTDSIDAFVIASFASVFPSEHETPNPSQEHLELKELVKYRDELKNCLTSEKLRLQSPSYSFSEKNIKKHMTFLEKQISNLNLKIDAIINNIEELKEKSSLMQSMPGVGKETAISLLSYLPELGTLGPKKVASLLGVAPFTKESGQYKGVARIMDGRPRPRKALYMAALSASRHCPVFKEFYNRLINKGKPPKKVLVAVMRRMAVVLDAMLENNTEWVDKSA